MDSNRVLIVLEDLKEVKRLTKIIERSGFQASACSNTLRARIRITEESFCAVICGLIFDGVTGVGRDFIEWLDSHYPVQRVIVYSPVSDLEVAHAYLEFGVGSFIATSFPSSIIAKTIMRVTGSRLPDRHIASNI